MSLPSAHRIEVFTAAARRRRWSAEDKAQIVAESYATTVGAAAARHSLNPTQIFEWRRMAREREGAAFAPVILDRASTEPSAGAIEVELDGARIRIPPGSDLNAIGAVLSALKSSR